MNKFLFCAILSLAIAAPTMSAAAPSAPAERFVGTWELDVAMSSMDREHPATDYGVTRAITWDGTALTEADSIRNMDLFGIKLPQSKAGFSIVTDNLEHNVSGLNRMVVLPSKTMAHAHWEGDNLLLRGYGNDPLGYWTLDRRFFISSDGKHLTEVIRDSSALGEFDTKLVFTKIK